MSRIRLDTVGDNADEHLVSQGVRNCAEGVNRGKSRYVIAISNHFGEAPRHRRWPRGVRGADAQLVRPSKCQRQSRLADYSVDSSQSKFTLYFSECTSGAWNSEQYGIKRW